MLAVLLWVANRKADKLARETLTPALRAINDVKTKKRIFFACRLSLVQQSNNDASQEQIVLLQVSKQLKQQRPLTEKQAGTMLLLAKKYRVTA